MASLGVQAQVGGEHPRMGTHNLLLRLGEALFLEIIAVNPGAASPTRPRWFALDTLTSSSPARLSTWVVRSEAIHNSCLAASEDLGNIEPMTRGALNWLITIPADGSVPLQGVAPALIEWQTETHPASRLQDFGLSLAKLELLHPEPEKVSALLASLHLQAEVAVLQCGADGPQLRAFINTPSGVRCLPTTPLCQSANALPT